MLRNILSAAMGMILAVLIISGVEKFTGWLSGLFAPSLPSGAVVAFDSECSDGWQEYRLGAGKFLLGAGKGKKLHDVGGEENHTLTEEEMPNHNHKNGPGQYLVRVTGGDTVLSNTDNSPGEINIRHGNVIREAGGGKPHNNMPPYIALHFCKKD